MKYEEQMKSIERGKLEQLLDGFCCGASMVEFGGQIRRSDLEFGVSFTWT
jgi:hypothetical protein